MGTEIERKFLVRGDGWRTAPGTRYRQGYLSSDPARTVRVRVAGTQAWITIKGVTEGLARREYEYAIPLADAEELLERLCAPPLIDKTRYRVTHAGHTWEVDEFHGDNQGLVIAEVELGDEREAVILPSWVGEEVSHDPRYFNSNLARRPFRTW